MIERTDLPQDYRPVPVSEGSLKTLDLVALCLAILMTLGPLSVTAYQNPYSKTITAVPNLPASTTGNR